jgi:hypothetical protein
MESRQELTTKEKALRINLDPRWYGSFAEIGAGQEIADHFFKAGGASGTIAKTMSAYDMQFSDAIYGKSRRYVSQERLLTMLGHEYQLLHERLGARAERSCFFAIANTVEALNFRKTNRGHGWMGVRFQAEPGGPTQDVVLHVVLKDPEGIWQQEALGIIGVNLLFACFYHATDTDTFLKVLLEGLSTDRIEVDACQMSGPAFAQVDNRLLSLKLVKTGMTSVAMFGPDGQVLHPSDVLYKKNLLVLRGRFRPVTLVNEDMLRVGVEQFLEEDDVAPDNMIVLTELTLRNLTADGRIDDRDFLDRADILGSLGHTVLISSYQEYYKLVSYFGHYTRERKIGIVAGVYNVEQIFDPQYYQDLRGGILEAFGILFGSNVKLFVYPSYIDYSQEIYRCSNLQLPEHLQHLFQFLFATNKLEDLEDANPALLHITSDEVLERIRSGKAGWEVMVPPKVAEMIRGRSLFGYREQPA